MNTPVTKQKLAKKKDITHQLILDTAARLFAKHGYHATPLKEIAADVNMKAGSLYYHFSSKEKLMQEVLDRSIQVINQMVQKEVDKLQGKDDFESLLRASIRGHLLAILKYSDYTSTSIRNYGQIPGAVQQASQQPREKYEQFWREMMNKGLEQGVIREGINVHLLRLTIFGGMNWASTWFKEGRESVETIAEAQTDLFLKGCLA